MKPAEPAVLQIVILAAGAATRFGSPKQLARVQGHPLLPLLAARAVEVAGSAVSVVLGAHAEQITPLLRHSPASVVINRDWSEGLASSIRAGIRPISGHCQGALLLLADQASVTAEDLKRLSDAWRRQHRGIAAAYYQGITGVPAIFPREYFPQLLALRGDQGARALLQRHLDRLIRVPMPNAAFDLDTPQDLLTLPGSHPSRDNVSLPES